MPDRHADLESTELSDAGDDSGQAAVEFAIALPLIAVVMLAIAQLGVSTPTR